MMWINITDKGGKFQFNACVCYLPPVDSTRNVDAQDFYDTVLSQIHTYGKTGLFFMCGDLNSRCADMEDFIPGVDDIIERDVIDYVSNAYGEILCDFLINSNCCILNGRNTKRNNYTYVSTRGSSVVDYCIVPYENVCRFTDFEVSTMSELMQNYNLFDSVDQCVSKPDHSLLAWNMCLDKLTKSHDENKSKETEVKKFDFSNIPSSFLDNRLRDIEDLILQLDMNMVNQDGINKLYGNFVDILKNEMNDCLDYKTVKLQDGQSNKKRRTKKPWWSDQLTVLWNKVCEAEKDMLKCKITSRKREFRSVFIMKRKNFDREAQRAKRHYWRNKVLRIDELESGNQREFWKEIGRIGVGQERRKLIPMEVQLQNGEITNDKDSVLSEWKNAFYDLLNANDDSNTPETSIDSQRIHEPDIECRGLHELNDEISIDEVQRAVRSLKMNKAVGVDEIPAELFKNVTVIPLLHKLFNKCFFHGNNSRDLG
ncbi:Hypothetical predicted protein [Mytilus galloprovincialis]|uniref:Endonuclease/exonuclease/phosphatase domain-containing protein n=1 Tax=Mytilus galloprovincialis TaxID=29158 RepID=A0A8B6BVI9_MYTGA|nr:Hypothetical predicted protein [Mytilus galloprovincialis]